MSGSSVGSGGSSAGSGWSSDDKIGQGLSNEKLLEYGLVLSSYFSADHEHRFMPQYAAVSAPTRARSQSPPRTPNQPEEDLIDPDIPDDDLLALLPKSPTSSSERPKTAPNPPKQRWRGIGWDDDSHGNRIVLKIDLLGVGTFFGNEFVSSNYSDADNNSEKEKRYLRVLQNCEHIVKLIAIPNDPLARTASTLQAHLLSQSNWFFEEYLENGSLSNFIEKFLEECKNKGLTPVRLPNRLLWSIFFCLVKMIVALAWPLQSSRDRPERCILKKPISSIQHNDIHEGNIPILKLIDFAGADTMEDDRMKRIGDEGPAPEGVTDNIFAIGKTMAILVSPDQWDHFGSEIYPERPQTVQSFVPFMMNPIETVAVEIANPASCPGIDNDIKDIIIACLASEPGNRPTVLQLHEYVRQGVNDRDVAYYQNLNDQENERRRQLNLQPQDLYDISMETNEYIRQILDDIMLTPPSSNV
ncbi:hypothetical protein CHU98_g251 [Xylaria longipes]|nr:hypothetical protein CHU98_g251 [Xylaria longipes]